MIKRTLEISSAPAHLTIKNRQLVLRRGDETVGSFPCEDLGLVLVDHPGTTYSHAALSSLIESEAVMLLCGRNHLPAGILLPLADHSQIVWRIHEQIEAGKPLCKRLWQQLVRAKIRGQAENLEAESAACRKLRGMVRRVRSGDPENLEAQAARIYWGVWLASGPQGSDGSFRRDPQGAPPNNLLNYGYAVVRAALARALVAAGLMPALGLKHSNRSNAFCLADDLIEPLRPLVDHQARSLFESGRTELDQPTKAALLEILTQTVRTGDQTGPLMVALHRYAASLVHCYQATAKKLEIPCPCNSADTDVCGS